MKKKIPLVLSNKKCFLVLSLFLINILGFSQERTRLPNPINSPKNIEYAPSVTADGNTLIYQSDQFGLFVNSAKKVPEINADGKNAIILDEFETKFFGVYEAKLHPSGTWMPPKHIAAINEYANENMTPIMGGPSISYDGNTIYFFANFGKSGYGREDIYISERTKSGWSKPENIGSSINSDGYEGFPSISPDGKKLYFTREILGKKVEDKQCYRIMVSEKGRNNKWRSPIELPAPINQDCEKAPRILADGKTLVYSSIKKEGRGDFDLYKSTEQENGGWSTPVNLEFINTKKSDLFVSVSPCGDLMYFVSNGDIFTTTIPESLRPIRSATIQGFVLDSVLKSAISARVIVKEKESGTVVSVIENNQSDGRFTVIVPFGKEYELSVNLPEYYTKKYEINLTEILDCKPIPKDFLLRKLPTEAAEIARVVQKNSENKPEVSKPAQLKSEEIVSLGNDTKTVKEVISTEAKKDKIALENSQTVIAKPTTPTSPIQPIKQAAPIEELELIADSQETNSQKITAEGEKPTGTKLITKFALILRIVDKETGEFIQNPTFTFTKPNEQLPSKPTINGNDYIFQVLEGDQFKLDVVAAKYVDFSANIPSMVSDKRVTIKMAPKLKSSLRIVMMDKETNEKLSGLIKIVFGSSKDTVSKEIINGELFLPIDKSSKMEVFGSKKGYFSLSEKVDFEIPENGNKVVDLELKLVRDEYNLELQALDLETGKAIANAVFYVFDPSGKRVLELISDASGKAKGILNKNGKYKVQLLGEGYKTSEQSIDNLLANTQVLFKSVSENVKNHEIKVLVFDRFTQEELYASAKVNKEDKGKAPFFIQGPPESIFEVDLGGENIRPEKYKLAFNDTLINKVNTTLLAQKNAYEFYFRIIDSKSKKVIPRPNLKIIDLQTKIEVQNPDQSQFKALLDPSKSYTLLINQDGYDSYSKRITAIDWIKEKEFEKDLFLIPSSKEQKATENNDTPEIIKSATFGEITKGKKIVLENIYFDQSSPVLRKESFTQLDELVKILKENPKIAIEVRGHTDNEGDFYLNVKLSKERCESVIKYLTSKGINEPRMTPVGKGPIEPIAPNTSEDNKKKNRRVEFMVL